MARVYSREPEGQRERDHKENERSRLPEGERVELPVIWVVELYTPSTVSKLLAGIRRLGWERGRSRDESLVEWMSGVREGRRAGWISLGLVTTPERNHFASERVAALPSGVEAALPVLMSLTPSLTALVTAFLMTDEAATSLDGPLRAAYATRTERDPAYRWWHVIPYILWNRPLRSGHRFYSPDMIRRNEVRASLRRLEEDCIAWVSEWMPGVFASGLSQTRNPTAVLLVTEVAAPLSEETRGTWAFGGLAIDRDYDAWESDEWPGGRLVESRAVWDDEDRRLVFACRRRDAFPDRAGYVDPSSNWTLSQRADDFVRGLASRWALSCLLDYYHERVSALRDRSAARWSYRPVRDLKALRSLVQTQLYDVITSTQEVVEFAESDRFYRHDVLEMTYLHPRGEEPVHLLQELQSTQASRARQVQRDALLLQSTLMTSSEITQTISNMRMQRLLVFLTIVSIAIASVALFIALR